VSIGGGDGGDTAIPVSPGKPSKTPLQKGSSISRLSASLSRGMSFRTAFRSNAGEAAEGAADGSGSGGAGSDAGDLSRRRMTQSDVIKVLTALEFAYPATAMAVWFSGRDDGLPLDVWKRAVMEPPSDA